MINVKSYTIKAETTPVNFFLKMVVIKPVLILCLGIFLTSADKDGINEFTEANNQFTSAIFKLFSKTQKGNFLVSPFSAEAVLAFAQSGCKGETAEELRNALHLPNDKNKVESAIKALLPKFKGNELFTLHTANKFYVKKDYPIKEEFKTAATQVYQADIEPINFAKNVEAAKTMNTWVENQTNKKITDIISPQNLNQYTRVVLINALYFKGNWSNPFPLEATEKRDFYKSEKEVIKADYMSKYETEFNYYECPHLKAKFLELPFKGNDVSFVIVLPNKTDGLASFQNQLDLVFMPRHKFQLTNMNVALPKFHIESTLDFTKVLLDLGVVKAFDERQADLSGIGGEKGDLVVSSVVQKTFIDVTEQSVEAAAATAFIAAMPVSLPPPVTPFIADHPFIFYIKFKDLVIFAGRVTEPKFEDKK